jgi:hypothetical protein
VLSTVSETCDSTAQRFLRGIQQFKGEEEIGLKLDSAEPMKFFRLEVYLEDNCGGIVDCYRSGPPHEGESLQQVKHPEKQWPGWIYTFSDAPAGQIRLAIMLRFKQHT